MKLLKVFPVPRSPLDLATALLAYGGPSFSPYCVVVAVAEDALDQVLEEMPESWKRDGKLVLLQNELLPEKWERHKVQNPTVFR